MKRREAEASNYGYCPRLGSGEGEEEACRLAGVGAFLSVYASDWGAVMAAGRARIAAVRRGFCLM